MTHTIAKPAVLIALLSAPLAACASMAPPPPAEMAHCPLGYHTEAFPNNPDPRRAYQCWSDQTGYLRNPGDERERMAPYSPVPN